MKVVIAAATKMEWQSIYEKFNQLSIATNNLLEVSFLTTGIGVMASTYSLCNIINLTKPNLIIQVGIAGSFLKELKLSEVVAINEECQGDMVVEENNQLLDMFDLKLKEDNLFPFTHKKLPNPWIDQFKISCNKVDAITNSEITTNPKRIEQLTVKYKVAIETMEGAALHYVCLQNNIPFLQLKSISNYVGERDKKNWKIKEAVANLTLPVIDLLLSLKADDFKNHP